MAIEKIHNTWLQLTTYKQEGAANLNNCRPGTVHSWQMTNGDWEYNIHTGSQWHRLNLFIIKSNQPQNVLNLKLYKLIDHWRHTTNGVKDTMESLLVTKEVFIDEKGFITNIKDTSESLAVVVKQDYTKLIDFGLF